MKVITAAFSALLLVAGGLVAVLVAIAGGGAATPVSAFCATDANLATILATIRTVESGDNYTISTSGGGTASGAYKFVDGTWDSYGGYVRAKDAPPEMQDQKAAEMVRSILSDHDGDVTTVPVVWYLGHLPATGDATWDTVPAPEYGNSLTPREYQTKWMVEYRVQQGLGDAGGACSLGAPSFAGGTLPDYLSCGEFTWGGYRNGNIPDTAMRYRAHSGQLHPAASVAFDELYAAAQTVGLDLRGSGYRPAAAGGNTAGRSCHGLGLALDIQVLTGDPDIAFTSAEFTWLCANAGNYGWITPRWAIPEGMRCGSVVGTGAGGNVGNQCCFLEAWHIEAAGIVATHLDFADTAS